MITELENEWEICTCDGCVITGAYDRTYRFFFSGDTWYGAEVVKVDGYGSSAVAKITQVKSKAVNDYSYVNIYYDAGTNTSTAYICSRGLNKGFEEGLSGTEWTE